MPTVLIPKSVMALVPAPRTQSVVAALRASLSSGAATQPAPPNQPPYTSIEIPDDIYMAINTGRGAAARYISAVIMGTEHYEPVHTEPRVPVATVTGKQSAVMSARADRVRTALEDAEDGKWSRLIFTAGHRTVDQYREDGDYEDEIAAGVVFRTIIPNHTDAVKWVQRKCKDQVNLSRMHWHYIDADSETITDARDAVMRAQARMQGGEAAAAVELIERDEALEVKLLGRKSAYIALARIDCALLGVDAPSGLKRLAGR